MASREGHDFENQITVLKIKIVIFDFKSSWFEWFWFKINLF